MIFPLDQNKIISFTEYDSYDEDDESDVEMTTHVQYVLDTSYILSDDLHESRTSVTTESEQSDNDEDEELERYRIIDPIDYLSLTADRHVQKRSYMKRKHPQKKHQFDV